MPSVHSRLASPFKLSKLLRLCTLFCRRLKTLRTQIRRAMRTRTLRLSWSATRTCPQAAVQRRIVAEEQALPIKKRKR